MEPIVLNATVIGRAYADVHKDAEGKPAKLSALENVRITLQVPALTPTEISFPLPVLGVDELMQGSEVEVIIVERGGLHKAFAEYQTRETDLQQQLEVAHEEIEKLKLAASVKS